MGGKNVPSGGPLDAHDVSVLEDTARYAVLLLAPVEGFNQGFFCPWGKKKSLIMLFWPIFGNFWCPVVTLATLKEIPKNKKNPQKIEKFQKIQKYKKRKKI